MHALVLVSLLAMSGCFWKDNPIDDETLSQSIDLSGVTYSQDIAPMLAKRCTSCHNSTNGIAPISFNHYESVTYYAGFMNEQMKSREMPPWGAVEGGTCGKHFKDSLWLSDEELALFQTWIDTGMKRGLEIAELEPEGPSNTLEDYDLLLDTEWDGVHYNPINNPAKDEFRCFMLPYNQGVNYAEAISVEPEVLGSVHHAIVMQFADANSQASAYLADAMDPGPGFDCESGTGGTMNTRIINIWTPGKGVETYPLDTGVKLEANLHMIVQLHLSAADGDKNNVRTFIKMKYAPSFVKPIYSYLVRASNFTIPPYSTVTVSNISPMPTVTQPVQLHAIYMHSHLTAKSQKLSIIRGGGSGGGPVIGPISSGSEECLLDLKKWDFYWQRSYFYDELKNHPVILYPGDSIRIECTYVNNTATTVIPGENSNQEMCLGLPYYTTL